MQKKTHKSVQWLQFDLLSDFSKLSHAVFLRHGGFSASPFTSLNIGDNVGDNLKHVAQNRKVIQDCLHIPHIAWMRQCHGNTIHEAQEPSSEPYVGDALMTNRPDIGLLVGHADCQATLIYDPINHAIANVHCGWRGSVQNIYASTIEKMHHLYGSHAKELLVCISPSLGPASAQFVNYREELPTSFWDFQPKQEYFDFWEISRWQLQKVGVLPHHIEIAGIDTYTNASDYFSYRRDKQTGRHATIIMLGSEVVRQGQGPE